MNSLRLFLLCPADLRLEASKAAYAITRNAGDVTADFFSIPCKKKGEPLKGDPTFYGACIQSPERVLPMLPELTRALPGTDWVLMEEGRGSEKHIVHYAHWVMALDSLGFEEVSTFDPRVEQLRLDALAKGREKARLQGIKDSKKRKKKRGR